MDAVDWIMSRDRFQRSAYNHLEKDALIELLLTNPRVIDLTINWAEYRQSWPDTGDPSYANSLLGCSPDNLEAIQLFGKKAYLFFDTIRACAGPEPTDLSQWS